MFLLSICLPGLGSCHSSMTLPTLVLTEVSVGGSHGIIFVKVLRKL